MHNRSTTSLDELPQDDLVRIPKVPDGYELAEVTWTEGLKPDGSFGGLSEIHFAYEAPDLLPIQVNIARPVKVAGGRPYKIVVPDPSSGMRQRTIDVAGHPAIYEFPDPDADMSGYQLLIVANGEQYMSVSTYRGVAYSDIVSIAESVLNGGAP